MVRSVCLLCALVVVVLSTPLLAQLSLSPHEIDVNDVGQSETVRITYDGKPVLPGEIIKIASGVTKTGNAVPEKTAGISHFSDYSYMFDFEVGDDGVVTLRPNKGLIEIGSYDLVVKTVYGTIKGVIKADLRDSIAPLPPRTENLSKFSYDLKLADYTYGQAVSIELIPDQKNTYTWYIDGKMHASGPGVTSFRAWPEPGVHEISYIARSPAGGVVSSWSDTTEIAEEIAIKTTARKGYKIPFSAPGGYTQVTWMLDGQLVSDNHLDRSANDTQLLTFRSKGTYLVTCLARGSESGDFRHITWSVKVK